VSDIHEDTLKANLLMLGFEYTLVNSPSISKWEMVYHAHAIGGLHCSVFVSRSAEPDYDAGIWKYSTYCDLCNQPVAVKTYKTARAALNNAMLNRKLAILMSTGETNEITT
jgi:hypothetical protein